MCRIDAETAGPHRVEGGELEVRAGGCDGEVVARLPLGRALQRERVTTLRAGLGPHDRDRADLCFQVNAKTLEPMWAIERVTLRRDGEGGRR